MKFIYIEGADGIGKTTLIKKLKTEAEKQGIRVYTTREPDYAIREELLSPGKKEYDYYVQRLLMGASHIQKLRDLIEVKNSGDYDVAIIDRTSVVSDYIYGSKLQLDKNFEIVQRGLQPIIKEVNTELKENSYLILGTLNEQVFEERLSFRKDGQDVLDTYEIKRAVKEKYDEYIDEVKRNHKYIATELYTDHFNDIMVIDFANTDLMAKEIIKIFIKGEE